MTEIDDVLRRARSLLDDRQLWWALELLEERRFLAGNDARMLKAIDRFERSAIDRGELRQYYDQVREDLETAVSWLAYSRLDGDLWTMTVGELRSACTVDALLARRPDLGLDRLPIAEAVEELSRATDGFTEAAVTSHLAKAGPLLIARIGELRRAALDD